jgi:hypothetical protein
VVLALLALSLTVPQSAQAAVPNLPEDGPAALYKAEPAFPPAPGWPGTEAFSRTSGTGRMSHGALLWTDWLFDDHGALTAPLANPDQTAGSPSFGGYGYPAGKAFGNGADIWRSGVTESHGRTYWRVDWTTLADPSIPIAEWAFDRDANAATGSSSWPAGAGVSSPGIDTALVMSAKGARLLDLATGRVLATSPVRSSTAAHSFVTSFPASVLAPTGTWRIRLVSGLADAAGTGFAPATGALPGQTAVYNASFRDRTQEPVTDSFWDDLTQTSQLTQGSVAPFSHLLTWKDVAAGTTTAVAHPTGWQTRWYVSAVHPGEGLLSSPASIEDHKDNFLGVLQPYSVYVPQHLPARAPLTWLLHSLTQNHNQYAATTPHFTQQACEARHSLCVTTNGRGGDGFYVGNAQLDFWQVWHEVSLAWGLDVDRTVLAGYSMGGIGSNQLAMAHPDLFAQEVTLAGAVGAVPELENLRSVPVYSAGGVEDELVPAPVQKAQADALKALGFRYRWLLYPAEDHVALELQDGFSDAAAFMGSARRTTRPAHVTLRWSPVDVADSTNPVTGALGSTTLAQTQRPDLGIGTTGAYWLRSLKGRSGLATARVDAVSSALPDPTITLQPSRTVDPLADPSPAVVTQQTWRIGASPARSSTIRLSLTGVAAATLLTADAGLPVSGCSTVVTTTDGPTTLRLAGASGRTAEVLLHKGSRTLRVRTAASSAPVVGPCTTSSSPVRPVRGSLPTTGPVHGLAAAGLALLLLLPVLRRTRSS